MNAEQTARLFHEVYERRAPLHGYKTREASAVPWDEVPLPNRHLMVEVAFEVNEKQDQELAHFLRTYSAGLVPLARDAWHLLADMVEKGVHREWLNEGPGRHGGP